MFGARCSDTAPDPRLKAESQRAYGLLLRLEGRLDGPPPESLTDTGTILARLTAATARRTRSVGIPLGGVRRPRRGVAGIARGRTARRTARRGRRARRRAGSTALAGLGPRGFLALSACIAAGRPRRAGRTGGSGR